MDPKKRILVVEDIPESLEATVEELRQRGHLVTECRSIAEALAKLNEQDFDLMIVDWRIPERDGGSVIVDGGAVLLEAIREGGARAANMELPFVVVSGQRSSVRAEAVEAGRCLGVVGKLSPKILDGKLREVLGRG